MERTRQEIDALKDNWRQDPSWDLHETEGFAAHADELREFQERTEELWRQDRRNRELRRRHANADRLAVKAAELGCEGNLALADYVERLDHRLAVVEAVLVRNGLGADLQP